MLNGEYLIHPPIPDVRRAAQRVRFVPEADIRAHRYHATNKLPRLFLPY